MPKKSQNGVTLSLRELKRMPNLEPEDDLTKSLRVERPQTRGDCLSGPRPCPWVSCRHHLYLDVNTNNGSLLLHYGGMDLEDVPHTCSLDVADDGGKTFEEVAQILHLSRERIRQLEARALRKVSQSEDVRELGYTPLPIVR
jgi:hypothetical protein